MKQYNKGRKKNPFLKAGRLSDVIALIQVLSLDEKTHRSTTGITSELQREPEGNQSWEDVAKEHPEFFRINTDPSKKRTLSLISRHVTPKDESEGRILNSDVPFKLMQLAVTLHDREITRSQSWQKWLSPLSAIIGGGLTLIGVWMKSWLSGGTPSP